MVRTYGFFKGFCDAYKWQWDGTRKGRDYLMSQMNDRERQAARGYGRGN